MKRRRITATLPDHILKRFEDFANKQLGIGRNALFAFACLFMLVQISHILGPKKRSALLNDLEKAFETMMEEARKAV